jgi:hypothetical protein
MLRRQTIRHTGLRETETRRGLYCKKVLLYAFLYRDPGIRSATRDRPMTSMGCRLAARLWATGSCVVSRLHLELCKTGNTMGRKEAVVA